ncbi:MAG: SDR family NAD(P)-dependent oxidoreductase, partial [Halothermotrichaceae bacterium]
MIIIKTKKLFDLNGEVAIVTGSTKGLGKGIAEVLAEFGAKVVITSRHQDDCNKIAMEINKKYGVNTLPVSTDVTELSEVKSLVNKTLDEFNKINILINNAGTAITKKAENISEKEWDHILEVNLKGYFLMAREVGKHMIETEQGKIINVSSIFGEVGEKMILPYLASKGGVNQLTRGLALEWAKYNVQVNAIAPAYIVTP